MIFMRAYDLCSVVYLEINAGFESLEYTAEESVSLLEVCLKLFGSASLSQPSLVKIMTLPGTAEGILHVSS